MKNNPDLAYDVIIIGGGPAGLSAALVLGRACRRVLICDNGQPRNAASHGLHAFLTRDGIKPIEFLKLARSQVTAFDNVHLRDVEVTSAQRLEPGFEIGLQTGEKVRSRKLILATGVRDEIPDIPGIMQFYGRTVHHCPLCDGWEHRNEPLAVLGCGKDGAAFALELRLWSDDVVLCTNGNSGLEPADRERLQRNHVAVREEAIARLEGSEACLSEIVFDKGEPLARKALFFCSAQPQKSHLVADLGCDIGEEGKARHERDQSTCVDDVYLVGNAGEGLQLVIVAAAEGAKAAAYVIEELVNEDFP